MRDMWPARRNGFTFLEVMVVIIMIGILAAVVVPRFTGVTEEAKSSAVQGTLGGVRSSIAAYRAKAVLAGSAPYPTLEELLEPGFVVQQEIPVNPFTGVGNVQAVSRGQADARAVVGSAVGWNYFVDNSADPPVAIFYANSDAVVTGGNGTPKGANEL